MPSCAARLGRRGSDAYDSIACASTGSALFPPLDDQLCRSSDLKRRQHNPELYVAALFASQARAGEVSRADQPPLTSTMVTFA